MKIIKLKSGILFLSVMTSGIFFADAATITINNVSNGSIDQGQNNPGDTLWALNNNTLMNSGTIAMGYFNTSLIFTENVDTVQELVAQLTNFVTITSLTPGGFGVTLQNSFPGYAEGVETTVPGGQILAGNALLGRDIYQIVTNASVLANATVANQFALLKHGSFTGDDATTQQISGFPVGITPILSGGTGTFVNVDGSAYAGAGTYNTLRLTAPIPEPSALLLSGIGALALLRRKR